MKTENRSQIGAMKYETTVSLYRPISNKAEIKQFLRSSVSFWCSLQCIHNNILRVSQFPYQEPSKNPQNPLQTTNIDMEL